MGVLSPSFLLGCPPLGSVIISRSVDDGYTWAAEVELCDRRSWGAPTSVTVQDGRIYRAFETCPPTGRSGGGRSSSESFVMAGDVSKDLMDPRAWRASPQARFPGTPAPMQTHANAPETGTEDCWIEGNLISVQGRLRNVLRLHIHGRATVGMSAICDLDDDGETMDYRFRQYCPMIGGQCKFHIVYDRPSRLYWTTVNPVSDTLAPVDARLREVEFQCTAGNERRILLLIYSVDAQNWFQGRARRHESQDARRVQLCVQPRRRRRSAGAIAHLDRWFQSAQHQPDHLPSGRGLPRAGARSGPRLDAVTGRRRQRRYSNAASTVGT